MPDYDDNLWRSLSLPHDWSIESSFSKDYKGENGWLPGGIGWYRKTFFIPKSDKGKHIEIEFDGIYRHSKIWVNGAFVGMKYDGYTSFYFDITEAIEYGKNNVIAIRVDNSVQPNCRWYSGSGIYRNVWLTKTNLLHVKNWGTYITTPQISKEKATVKVATTIENFSHFEENAELTTAIYDEEDKEVAISSKSISLGNLRTSDIEQDLIVTNPRLWSLDNLHLYYAKTTISKNGNIIDDYKSTFGIRKLTFDGQNGFFLNDKNLKMKGVCLHHDAGAFGAAVPIEVWKRRLEKLKAIGCNAIRTSHNPTSQEFLDLCDKMGFLVMDELKDKWNFTTLEPDYYAAEFADPYFHIEWKENYKETICRDRNHPSIIIWSVGNENHAPGSKEQNLGLKRYCSFIRSLDSTRPIVSGMERSKDKNVNEIIDDINYSCSFMDLTALNYGEQWCKAIHDKSPLKPYVSTESYTYFGSTPEKRWANLEHNAWLDVMNNRFNMGLFLWVGVNYLGESRKWPVSGSTSGLFDLACFPTPRANLFEAFWSDKPVVHLNVYEGNSEDLSKTGRWGWPSMFAHWNLEKGKKYDLVTYTNCEEVDLYLNNKKIGSKKLADFPNWIMKWKNIEYKSGTLKAIGKRGGVAVCEETLVTSGKPERVSLINYSDKQKIKAGELIQLEMKLTDNRGRIVANDDRKIHFDIEGEGDVIVLANGSLSTEECLVQKEDKKTYNGKLLCVIKTKNKSGQLKIKATSPGMKSTIFTFQVVK